MYLVYVSIVCWLWIITQFLGIFIRLFALFPINLRSWEEFYVTAGRSGRAKYQLWPDSYILQSACEISMKGICTQKKKKILMIFVHKSCQWYLLLKISGLVSLRCCEYSMIVKAACHAWRPLIILHLIWPFWYLFWKDARCNITKVMQALYLEWKDIPLKTCW